VVRSGAAFKIFGKQFNRMKTKQRENNFRRSLQDFSATRPSTTERPQAVHEKLEPMTKHSIKILTADDSEDDRMIFQLALHRSGEFEVCGVAVDGIDTINYLNAMPPYSDRGVYPYPDLLLLDYQMPGCTGLEVLVWLQHQPRRPKVVLWSHSLELIDDACAYDLGANVVCAKPDASREITATVFRALAGPLQRLAPDPSVRTADGRRLQETKRFAEKG